MKACIQCQGAVLHEDSSRFSCDECQTHFWKIRCSGDGSVSACGDVVAYLHKSYTDKDPTTKELNKGMLCENCAPAWRAACIKKEEAKKNAQELELKQKAILNSVAALHASDKDLKDVGLILTEEQKQERIKLSTRESAYKILADISLSQAGNFGLSLGDRKILESLRDGKLDSSSSIKAPTMSVIEALVIRQSVAWVSLPAEKRDAIQSILNAAGKISLSEES